MCRIEHYFEQSMLREIWNGRLTPHRWGICAAFLSWPLVALWATDFKQEQTLWRSVWVLARLSRVLIPLQQAGATFPPFRTKLRHGNRSLSTVSQEICVCPPWEKLMISMDTKITRVPSLRSPDELAIVEFAFKVRMVKKETDLFFWTWIFSLGLLYRLTAVWIQFIEVISQ